MTNFRVEIFFIGTTLYHINVNSAFVRLIIVAMKSYNENIQIYGRYLLECHNTVYCKDVF